MTEQFFESKHKDSGAVEAGPPFDRQGKVLDGDISPFAKPDSTSNSLSLLDLTSQGANGKAVPLESQSAAPVHAPGDRSSLVNLASLGPYLKEPEAIKLSSGDVSDSYADKSSISKMLDVGTGALAAAPALYVDRLTNELSENPYGVARNVGVASALGFGATGLLKAAPKKGKYVLGALLATQAVHYGKEAFDYFSQAPELQSHAQRDRLVNAGSSGLALEAVMMTEALPGIALGGYGGTKVFGKPQLFQEAEQFVSRKWAFNGPGSRTLPMEIKNRDGTINMFALDDAIGSAALDTGASYEVGRSVNLLNRRLSRPAKGTVNSHEVDMKFKDRLAHVRQHTHTDLAPEGILPSYRDIESTRHIGIINNGEKTTFYLGKMAEYEELLASGVGKADIRLPGQGIIIDRSTASPTATLFETHPIGGGATGNKLVFQSSVDFLEAEKALKALDINNAWPQLKSLANRPK